MTDGIDTRPVVVLCGFMGTGKTAVGEALARRLGVDFVDTDALIEARERMSIAAIFDKRGEAHFRALESEVCRALDPDDGAVIATGGGMVMDPRNFVHLQSLGTTVLLEASVDAILERAGSAGDRPLLSGLGATQSDAARERVVSLLESRRETYERCELRLDTTHRTPEESAYDVAEMIVARAAHCTLVPLRVETRPIPDRARHIGNTRLCRVIVGAGVCADLALWLQRLELDATAYILSPRHLEHLVARVTGGLDDGRMEWRLIEVDDGDAHKTLDQAARLVDELAGAGAGRDSVVVTVGGGVTGDLGGFVASMYMRGLPFAQVPTSLLAQVDASIGGKVGVNHARAKNLLGAVYQPHLVLTDPTLLSTLPDAEVANGMAEVIKTAIIGSQDLFERLVLDAGSESKRPSEGFLADAVAECARIKGAVVERDPFERDYRRVLNLGHTLGHALEAALGYNGIRHGEAVGLGLLAAWRMAVERGRADARWLDETRDMLEHFALPTVAPDADPGALRRAMGLDKKRRAGALTFVLPVRPGHVEIVDDVSDDEVIAAMRG